jgi:FMN phosphatase YigB (HAD superfamily)
MNSLKNFRLVVFDLDGTLYEENHYLFAAYQSISDSIQQKTDHSSDDIYKFLTEEFLTVGRQQLFNKLCHRFELPAEWIEPCLHTLRYCVIKNPPLKVYPEMLHLLKQCHSEGQKLAVLTNGNPEQQKNKISQLDFGEIKDSIGFYFANNIEPKPSGKGLEKILKDFDLTADQAVYIGDLEIDQHCAESAGTHFIPAKIFR